MKFKKTVKVLLSCLLAGVLFTGCGNDGGSENKDPDSQATIIKLGMITHLNASEKQIEEYLFKIQAQSHAKVLNHVPVFFDSLNLMLLGIEAGKVDKISTYQSVANYLLANNDRFEIVQGDLTDGLADNFCFAVRKEDSQLKADLDKVIGEMKSDGSLDKLINDYIKNVDKKNPPAIEIPKVKGAPTIKVGVTGDLPPLDYVSADGKAAGFNTALLAEIAKRLNRNVELVHIEGGARAAALNADQIDVVFWAIVPVNNTFPADIDKPEGLELSVPYFRDDVTHIELKN